jgi:hypothetical protein
LLYKCAIETPIDDLGCKGITTFRTAGKRYGVLNARRAIKARELWLENRA